MLLAVVDDELLRAEVGYLGAATLLCALLAVVYRRPWCVTRGGRLSDRRGGRDGSRPARTFDHARHDAPAYEPRAKP